MNENIFNMSCKIITFIKDLELKDIRAQCYKTLYSLVKFLIALLSVGENRKSTNETYVVGTRGKAPYCSRALCKSKIPFSIPSGSHY